MPPSPRSFALTIHRYFPHGGLQRIALDTALELASRGHRVAIITQEWRGPRPENERTEVVTIPPTSSSNHGRAKEFGAKVAALRGYDRVLGFDRSRGLDVYFAGDPCYAGRVRRTRPWVVRITPRYRALRSEEEAVFGADSSTRILLMNAAEASVFQAEYGTDPARFCALPPGYDGNRRLHRDTAAELRREVRAELGLSPRDHLALSLGSDIERKGFDRAVRAIAHAADAGGRVHLCVAGPRVNTRAAKKLTDLASQLGCGALLRLLGPRDDVAALLQGADVLLHPCRSEPAGMVLLEALGAGLPVLVSETAGYAKHVASSGADRVLPEPFEQDLLNERLIRLLREPREVARQSALDAVTGIEPDGMIHAVASFMERTAERPPSQ